MTAVVKVRRVSHKPQVLLAWRRRAGRCVRRRRIAKCVGGVGRERGKRGRREREKRE